MFYINHTLAEANVDFLGSPPRFGGYSVITNCAETSEDNTGDVALPAVPPTGLRVS